MPTQLRLYTINKGCLQQFAEEWRELVLPLRQQQGWQIERAWLIEENNQFAWLLSCGEDENWADKDEKYYASANRRAMDPNPARLIAWAEEYFIEALEL